MEQVKKILDQYMTKSTQVYTESNLDKKLLNEQIDNFRKLATEHQNKAKNILYWLICPSIVFISLIFIFAPFITAIDLWGVSTGDKIANQIALDKQTVKVSRLIAKLNDRIKVVNKQQVVYNPQGDLQEQNGEETNFLKDLEILAKELKKDQEDTPKLWSEVTNREFDMPALIQLNITRLGTVGIFAFAVTFFIGLYRNNVRLSVFYDARAKVLEYILINGNPGHLQKLSKFMSPNVHFGQMPSTPIEQITGIAKNKKKSAEE